MDLEEAVLIVKKDLGSKVLQNYLDTDKYLAYKKVLDYISDGLPDRPRSNNFSIPNYSWDDYYSGEGYCG